MIVETHRAKRDLQLEIARRRRTGDALAELGPSLVDVADAGKARALRHAIEHAILSVFGVDELRLFQRSRGRAPIALARQVAMYLAHTSCRLSLSDVGRVFDRDRTTVAHACIVIEDRRDEEVFDRAVELLEWVVPSLLEPHALRARLTVPASHSQTVHAPGP